MTLVETISNTMRGAYNDGKIEYSMTQFTDHTRTTEETLTAVIEFDLSIDGFCQIDSASVAVTLSSPIEYTLGDSSFSFGEFALN